MIKDLKEGSHIHLMGICGTAMASLAGLLKDKGFRVTGSDQNIYPPMSTMLANLDIPIASGYEAKNLDPRPDFIVVGNVISEHFAEAQEMRRLKIPYASLPETLGEAIIEDRHALVVSGTHGKTTTTSMLAWLCQCAGLKPGFLIGGIAKNFSQSYQLPQKDHFVIEGDEYDSAYFAKKPKFLFYKPRTVILSSIEFDHADIYPNLEAIIDAFSELLKIIPEKEGLLVYNAEDKNIESLMHHYKGAKVSYGWNKGDWTLSNLKMQRQGLEFDVHYQGKKEDSLFVPMFGEYNAMNALSAYVVCRERQFSLDIKASLAQFQGVKRRQELIGEPGGVQVIEDFAHHPTAVLSTLRSFQRREGHGKVLAIFEPRSNTSRRSFFQKEYTEALSFADQVWVSRPFQKGESSSELLDVNKIVKDLGGAPKARVFEQVEQAVQEVSQVAKSGDTVVIMSNGGFDGIYKKILKTLSSKNHEDLTGLVLNGEKL